MIERRTSSSRYDIKAFWGALFNARIADIHLYLQHLGSFGQKPAFLGDGFEKRPPDIWAHNGNDQGRKPC